MTEWVRANILVAWWWRQLCIRKAPSCGCETARLSSSPVRGGPSNGRRLASCVVSVAGSRGSAQHKPKNRSDGTLEACTSTHYESLCQACQERHDASVTTWTHLFCTVTHAASKGKQTNIEERGKEDEGQRQDRDGAGEGRNGKDG